MVGPTHHGYCLLWRVWRQFIDTFAECMYQKRINIEINKLTAVCLVSFRLMVLG